MTCQSSHSESPSPARLPVPVHLLLWPHASLASPHPIPALFHMPASPAMRMLDSWTHHTFHQMVPWQGAVLSKGAGLRVSREGSQADPNMLLFSTAHQSLNALDGRQAWRSGSSEFRCQLQQVGPHGPGTIRSLSFLIWTMRV